MLEHVCHLDLGSILIEEELAEVVTAFLKLVSFQAHVWLMDGLGTLPSYLEPLRYTLKSLEIWSYARTGSRRADFRSFAQLQVLRLPSAAYFQMYECLDPAVQQGFIWRVEDRMGIWALLPPYTKTFDLHFKCPTMIFTHGIAYLHYFGSLPDGSKIRGFE
jgi:hypothetical protein